MSDSTELAEVSSILKSVRFQESTGFQSFLPALLGKINICPTGKPIFLVPHTLAMPQQD